MLLIVCLSSVLLSHSPLGAGVWLSRYPRVLCLHSPLGITDCLSACSCVLLSHSPLGSFDCPAICPNVFLSHPIRGAADCLSGTASSSHALQQVPLTVCLSELASPFTLSHTGCCLSVCPGAPVSFSHTLLQVLLNRYAGIPKSSTCTPLLVLVTACPGVLLSQPPLGTAECVSANIPVSSSHTLL